jgi:hypothetical protein
MVGQPLDLLSQTIRVEPLDRFNDPRMEGAPALLEEAAVRHLVSQGVLEGVFQLREEASLVKELGGLELSEVLSQFTFRLLGDGLEDDEWYIGADDRSRLKKSLVLG